MADEFPVQVAVSRGSVPSQVLELLDHDWQLFTEVQTGQDAVLVRDPDQDRLLLAGDQVPDLADTVLDVEVRTNVPTLTVDEALDHLDAGQARFAFFMDARTGRGAVLYRRYDGHYGHIVPT